MKRGSFAEHDGGENTQADAKLIAGTSEQEAIWDVLLNSNKHVIVNAVAGCLTGDTIIGVNRGGISRPYKLEDVVHKFNGKERRWHQDRAWDLTIPTRLRSVQGHTVTLQNLVGALRSGIKTVYDVHTETGKAIAATTSHLFLTHDGWKTLDEILRTGFKNSNNRLFGDAGKGGSKLAPKPAYQRMVGMGAHPFHHKSKPHCCVWTHRLVVEADLNGLPLMEFVWLIRQCKTEGLKFLDPAEYYVHHADENTFNNERGNLEIAKPDEHSRHHAVSGAWDHVQAHVRPEKIVSAVRRDKLEMTYDLTMEMSSDDEPNFLANGLVVHNSGKTFVLTQYAYREKRARIGLTAFNKHIAEELTKRMGGQRNVECMTYHSMGYRTIRNNVRKGIQVDQYKTLGILDAYVLPVNEKQQKSAKYKVNSLVSYAKTYGYGADVSKAELEKLVDRHDVDMGDKDVERVVYEYVPKVLRKCMDELSTIDFDDMVWLPYVLGMKVQKYDVLCVDEYQDTSFTQQWLAVQGGVRVCAVGDPHQAIYAFRGCDGKGFERLGRELKGEVVTLPLTLTRRCPKSHVRLAQSIVPQICALEEAGEGVVRVTESIDAAVNEMRPGDLVVCRVNAELIGVAYKLLRRGVKAVVRGRDIAQGLTKLIDRAQDASEDVSKRDVSKRDPDEKPMRRLIRNAGMITADAIEKFAAMPHGKGERRAAAAQDKYDCLCELAQNVGSVGELKSVIERLFAEFEDDGAPRNAVVLGTVHRTKGLESNRVFVLRPDLIPHPMAKKDEDIQAEYNLAYVAVTRAKFEGEDRQGELVFVGGMCPAFEGVSTGLILEPPGTLEEKGKPFPCPEEGNAPINEPDEEDKAFNEDNDNENDEDDEDNDDDMARWALENENDVPEHRKWR